MTINPNRAYRGKVAQHLPAAATAAVVTLAARTDGGRHVVFQIDYSFGVTAPAASTKLTVTGLNDDGAITYTVDVQVIAGQYQMFFPNGLIGKANTAMVVTLASGGGTSVGSLNITYA